MKLLLKRSSLVLVATLLSVGLAELVVRMLGLGPTEWAHPWHLESPDKQHGVDVYPSDPRGYFEDSLHDEETLAHLAAHGMEEARERAEATPHAVLFRYSEELCRGPAIGPKTDRLRIVIVGDSFTEGQGVEERDTFAHQLALLLDGPEVISCGRRGYDFPRIHEFFDRQLALEPDVVIYAMTLNDPEQSAEFHDRQAFLNDWILDRRHMFQDVRPSPPWWQSRLLELVSDRVEGRRVAEATTSWYRDMVGAPNAAGWRTTQDHVEAMHDTMRERGGDFHVFVLPLFIGLENDYPFEAVHQTVTDAYRARGVAVHDTLPAFRGQDTASLWVHPSDRHPNEVAHRIIAEVMAEALRPALVTRP